MADILTITEAARVIADVWRGPDARPFSTRSVREWTKTRGLPFVKPAGRVQFFADQTEAWAVREMQRTGTARVTNFPGGVIPRQQNPTTREAGAISAR